MPSGGYKSSFRYYEMVWNYPTYPTHFQTHLYIIRSWLVGNQIEPFIFKRELSSTQVFHRIDSWVHHICHGDKLSCVPYSGMFINPSIVNRHSHIKFPLWDEWHHVYHLLRTAQVLTSLWMMEMVPIVVGIHPLSYSHWFLDSPHDFGNISPIGTESHLPLVYCKGVPPYNRMGMFMIGISLVSMD